MVEPQHKRVKLPSGGDGGGGGPGQLPIVQLQMLHQQLCSKCLCSLQLERILETLDKCNQYFSYSKQLGQIAQGFESSVLYASLLTLFFEVALKQRARGLLCTRISEVVKAGADNKGDVIHILFGFLSHSNKHVSYSAMRALVSLLLLLQGPLSALVLRKLANIMCNSNSMLEVGHAFEVVRHVVEWKDIDEHPIDANEASGHFGCHVIHLSVTEVCGTNEVKNIATKTLDANWATLVNRSVFFIKNSSLQNEHVIVSFLSLWTALISVKNNLTVLETKEFYNGLSSLVKPLLCPGTPLVIWEKILDLFNEVLCYGSTLALQEVLAEEPCYLAQALINAVNNNNLLEFVPCGQLAGDYLQTHTEQEPQSTSRQQQPQVVSGSGLMTVSNRRDVMAKQPCLPPLSGKMHCFNAASAQQTYFLPGAGTDQSAIKSVRHDNISCSENTDEIKAQVADIKICRSDVELQHNSAEYCEADRVKDQISDLHIDRIKEKEAGPFARQKNYPVNTISSLPSQPRLPSSFHFSPQKLQSFSSAAEKLKNPYEEFNKQVTSHFPLTPPHESVVDMFDTFHEDDINSNKCAHTPVSSSSIWEHDENCLEPDNQITNDTIKDIPPSSSISSTHYSSSVLTPNVLFSIHHGDHTHQSVSDTTLTATSSSAPVVPAAVTGPSSIQPACSSHSEPIVVQSSCSQQPVNGLQLLKSLYGGDDDDIDSNEDSFDETSDVDPCLFNLCTEQAESNACSNFSNSNKLQMNGLNSVGGTSSFVCNELSREILKNPTDKCDRQFFSGSDISCFKPHPSIHFVSGASNSVSSYFKNENESMEDDLIMLDHCAASKKMINVNPLPSRHNHSNIVDNSQSTFLHLAPPSKENVSAPSTITLDHLQMPSKFITSTMGNKQLLHNQLYKHVTNVLPNVTHDVKATITSNANHNTLSQLPEPSIRASCNAINHHHNSQAAVEPTQLISDNDEQSSRNSGDSGCKHLRLVVFRKAVLLVLKAIAVTVKEAQGESCESSSSSSEGSSPRSNAESSDTEVMDMQIIGTSLTGVLAKVDSFVKRHEPYHPMSPVSEWLVRLFAAQDDWMVEAMVCGLDTHQGLGRWLRGSVLSDLESRLCPHTSFLTFLDIVSYDASVLLDLLVSNETCFLLYLLRYLKVVKRSWSCSPEHPSQSSALPSSRQAVRAMTQLRDAISRLVARSVFPYNIAPVMRLLDQCHQLFGSMP